MITCSRVTAAALSYGVAALWASWRVLQTIAQSMSSACMGLYMSCMHLHSSLLQFLNKSRKQVQLPVSER